MKESDLFEPVKQLLLDKIGCEKVYAEVLKYDVVGTIGNHNIIVEMKKMLNFKVIEQAVDAKRHGHYVFVAVPRKKGGFSRLIENFLKHNGIGLIVIEEQGSTYHAEIPYGMFAKLNRKTDDIRKYIKDGYHDTISGGHKMGDFDYQSDYTLMMDDVKRYFQRYPDKWITVEEILNHCQCYYSSPKAQLAATLKANWNNDWVEHKVMNRKSHFKYIKNT